MPPPCSQKPINKGGAYYQNGQNPKNFPLRGGGLKNHRKPSFLSVSEQLGTIIFRPSTDYFLWKVSGEGRGGLAVRNTASKYLMKHCLCTEKYNSDCSLKNRNWSPQAKILRFQNSTKGDFTLQNERRRRFLQFQSGTEGGFTLQNVTHFRQVPEIWHISGKT